MLHAGPYSTWIVVDGTRLDTHSPIVYHNSRTNSSRVSGWITSEAGKKFSLSWHNATRGVALEAVVWIDGVECSRHVMLPACDFPDRPDTVRVSNTRTSEINRRDFLFSAVQVTDSDEYASSAGNVGAITLDLWRLHINRVVHRPLLHRLNGSSTMLEPQIVHERSKMDGMHHVRLGEEYSTPLPMVDMVDGERMDSDPYVSFTFNYRPRDYLQARGIIARPLLLTTSELARATTRRHLTKRQINQQHPRIRRGSIRAQMSISRLIRSGPIR